MPRGSAPGERRGGRAKGIPDKATAARQAAMAAAVADCFASMTQAQIEALTPNCPICCETHQDEFKTELLRVLGDCVAIRQEQEEAEADRDDEGHT